MRKPQVVVGVVGIALVAAVLGYGAHAARAGGVPTPNTMAYTGVLTNTAGTPVSSQSVTFSVWNAVSGGTAMCGPYAAVTTASDGSFSVPLDAACVTAVHATPNLWTQIQVAGETSPMPRTQIGAVPYALEAARTVVGVNSKLYSVGATYCASTPAETGNLLAAVPAAANGYAAGKSLCETACSSPSAHMCTLEEVMRSAAVGVGPTTAAWYSSGVSVSVYVVGGYGASFSYYDCEGWTNATSSMSTTPYGEYQGASWSMSGPQAAACGTSMPVMCCD